MPIALVRTLSDGFLQATRAHFDPAPPLHLGRARVQHAGYVEGLRGLGFDVRELPADPAQPDDVFIEDTAVIVSDRAVVLRSAHPGRSGEAASVAAALVDLGLDVVQQGDGHCDGGDVLVLPDRIVVGLSARTTAAGVDALRTALASCGRPIVAVTVPQGVLHLKCLVSAIDGVGTVRVAGAFDDAVFGGPPAVVVPIDEAYASNVVALGGSVLVAEGFPETLGRINALGLAARTLPLAEIRKADGSLTCLSLRLT